MPPRAALPGLAVGKYTSTIFVFIKAILKQQK
jgi:hypothetical protein